MGLSLTLTLTHLGKSNMAYSNAVIKGDELTGSLTFSQVTLTLTLTPTLALILTLTPTSILNLT